MNEDIKKRLASLEVNNFFDALYVSDMKFLLEQNEVIKLAIYEITLLRNSIDAPPHSNTRRRFDQIIDILNEGLDYALAPSSDSITLAKR